MDKIFLIGLPSSGKTTLGKKVASSEGLIFVDMDDEIEKVEGRSIPEIFEQNGESYFREVEQSVLKSLVEDSGGKLLISTGGGAPCFFDNIDLIKSSGVSVYLKVSPKELAKRLSKKGLDNRPLLSEVKNVEQEIEEKLKIRSAYYEQADVIIEGDQIQLNDLLNAIKYGIR